MYDKVMKNVKKSAIVTGLIVASAMANPSSNKANAVVELPSIINDNMVLQRETDAAIWGWDAPNTKVSILFRGKQYVAVVDGDGRWTTRVASGAAGTSFPLTIKGSSSVTLKNVAVGEVWIAGGQSNMWWHVSNSRNAATEAKNGDLPMIRVWDATINSPSQGGFHATTPQRTVNAQWKIATPQNVPDFPGVPYFFARELQKKLGVPVGIVHVAVPGTDIELHMNATTVRAILPQMTEIADLKKQLYPQQKQAFDSARATWGNDKAAVEKAGKPVPEEPKAPENPDNANYAGSLYNGMVAPAAPFTAKGFLWWQGENNAGRADQYRVLFPALIDDWRKLWKDDTLPFLFVELANFGPRQSESEPVRDDAWPAMRDAQRSALSSPKTYRIAAIDILDSEPQGASWNIHPINKQLAGNRLFLTALANVYGDKTVTWSGPVFSSAAFKSQIATVIFSHATGLKPREGTQLKGFAIAGSDRKWFSAQAKIVGNTVVLSSKDVTKPVAVRYDWHISPNGNLVNSAGLPMFPFRSDKWNLMTQ